MQLSTKYKIDSQKHEQLNVDFVKINTNEPVQKKSDNKIWKSGVGFGHQGRDEWDINAYIKDQERINSELANELDKINSLIHNFSMERKSELINIIEPSCLFTLIKNRTRGTTLLEVEKNIVIYTSIVSISKLITEQELWSRDNTLSLLKESFSNIAIECSNFLDHFSNEKTSLENVYQEIVDLHNLLEKHKLVNVVVEKNTNTEDIYVQELQNEVFSHMNIVEGDYTYKKQLENNSNPSKASLMRIVRELSSMPKSLPISFSSSVFFRADSSIVNVVKFIITGPKDTPYESGCFEFDALFKANYPTGPPNVLLRTTGNGSVRFNPNLYNCGKVCLSLLGTWSGQKGESWNDKASTFLQVLISIQSLIMVDEPYFNEPGWERQMHTEQGKKSSFDYSDNIRLQTLKWAILDKLKNPTKGFELAIKKHFYFKRDKIIKVLELWSKEAKRKVYLMTFSRNKDTIVSIGKPKIET